MHAAQGGAFMYMEFADFHAVIYLEAEISHVLLERPEEATAYRRIISSLEATALDAERSRDLIAKLAVELYGGEEPWLPDPARSRPVTPIHSIGRTPPQAPQGTS